MKLHLVARATQSLMNNQNHMKDTNVVGRWATVLALQKKRGIQGRTVAWGPPATAFSYVARYDVALT